MTALAASSIARRSAMIRAREQLGPLRVSFRALLSLNISIFPRRGGCFRFVRSVAPARSSRCRVAGLHIKSVVKLDWNPISAGFAQISKHAHSPGAVLNKPRRRLIF